MSSICVVVPVFRVEKYLKRCLDSIINQTYQDYTLVLVDDGSPDVCGEICDEYMVNNSQIIVIHQKNQGLSAARNAGIEWAYDNESIHWLTFIDSDDWVHLRYLEVLLNAAQELNTDISIVDALWTSGESLPDKIDEKPKRWTPEDYYTTNEVIATVAWGKLYKKECFEKIRYPVGKIHEDEYVTYRILFEKDYLSVVEQPLYGYFWNLEGITKQKWTPKRLDAVQAVEEQVVFFTEKGYLKIAQRCFKSLAFGLADGQDAFKRYDEMPYWERRKNIKALRRKLRSVYSQYKSYNWINIREDHTIFSRMWGLTSSLRRIWLQIKPLVIKKDLEK